MSMTFATNLDADSNNTRKIGTSSSKFILNDSGNYAAFYGTCATGASTAAKAVTCTEFGNGNLVAGTTIRVKFTYSNTASNPTLSVNGGTATTIYRYGTTAPSTSTDTSWNAGAVVSFTHDGSSWIMNDWINSDTKGTVNQNAVIGSSDTNKYSVIHAYDTTSTTLNSSAVYKAGATYQPSTGYLFIQDKPVVYGEYTTSATPSSPVLGQLWLKQSSMSLEEARVLVVSATTSSLPTTINDARIKSDMEVMKVETGSASINPSSLLITVANGSATISGSLSTSTTIKLWLLRGR